MLFALAYRTGSCGGIPDEKTTAARPPEGTVARLFPEPVSRRLVVDCGRYSPADRVFFQIDRAPGSRSITLLTFQRVGLSHLLRKGTCQRAFSTKRVLAATIRVA